MPCAPEHRGEAGAAAVVVAAGAGTRLGKPEPKLFVALAGRPLVSYALRAFEECGRIDEVVLVVPPGVEGEAKRRVVEAFSLGKVRRIVPGGRTRGHSVSAGLAAVSEGSRTVLVHDGARPFVSVDLILAVLEAAEEFGAAVPGLESVDTLKRVEDGVSVATLDRSRIRRIQTPQGFHRVLLREAYEATLADDEVATDDASRVERLGVSVRVIPGSPMNFKITTREDLALAEAIVAAG
jgi:2-C-methyl-D-erythritol 4-phosphate cytidylyltransferase